MVIAEAHRWKRGIWKIDQWDEDLGNSFLIKAKIINEILVTLFLLHVGILSISQNKIDVTFNKPDEPCEIGGAAHVYDK